MSEQPKKRVAVPAPKESPAAQEGVTDDTATATELGIKSDGRANAAPPAQDATGQVGSEQTAISTSTTAGEFGRSQASDPKAEKAVAAAATAVDEGGPRPQLGATAAAGEYEVIADAFMYTGKDEAGQVVHKRLYRGDVVSLTDDDAPHIERGLRTAGLAPVAQAEVARAEAAAQLNGRHTSDATLQKLPAAELVAFVVQHPDQAQRVANLEQQGEGRPEVLAAAGAEDE